VTRRAGAFVLAALLAATCTRASPDVRRVAPTTTGPSPGAPTSVPPTSPAAEGEPVRDRFAGRMVAPLPAAVARQMRGTTWTPGCPVPLRDLALLRFNYVGFDGEVKRGPMVVSASVADDVLSVFRRLFDAGFPLKRVALAAEYRPRRDARHPDTHHSVTAAFNCRPIVTPDGPGDTFSQHSYGLAVDVDPLQNPFVRADGFVRNRFARPYVDRSRDLQGMIHDGDVVVRAFAAIGWAWGGDWSSGKDYMHFSATGT
jgi:hypothetical protein